MNLNELIDFAINSGNNSIKAFEVKKENNEEVDFVDGI